MRARNARECYEKSRTKRESPQGLSLCGGLFHRGRDVRELPADDLRPDLVHCGHLRLRDARIDLAETDAVVLQTVDGVAAVERDVDDGLDRLEHRHVDMLRRAGQNVLRIDVGLVGIDADRPDVLLSGGLDHAEPAAARDLEHDAGAGGDLVQRDRLAEILFDEVLRVAVQRRDPRVSGPRAGLVAGDEPVDRRLLLTANGTDDVLAWEALLFEPREIAGEVADLLLAEEQPEQVRRLVWLGGLVDVHDRELRVREEMRRRVDRLRFREADADHDVVAAARERRQVRDVLRARRRQADAVLDAELCLRFQDAQVREMVEAAVVQAADVRDEPDLDRLARGGRRRGARCRRALLAAAAAAGCKQDDDDEGSDECARPVHDYLSIKVCAYGAKTSRRLYHGRPHSVARHARGRPAGAPGEAARAPVAARTRSVPRAVGVAGRLSGPR